MADERTEKQKVQEITDRWKANSGTGSTGAFINSGGI